VVEILTDQTHVTVEVWTQKSDTDDVRDTDIEYVENSVHVTTNTMTSFSTDYKARSKKSRKILQIHRNDLRLQERII
jgi:hypothetical protein